MEIDYDSLFCFVDDFCKGFEPWYKKQLLDNGLRKRCRNRQLSLCEVLTLILAYHQSGMACFKYFYISLLREKANLFPGLVHYARFTKLITQAFAPLICLLKSLEGQITDYLFIDSTPMPACHNRREKCHRVFKGYARKGKTSTGWFFGMKLHIIFNTNGEIVRLTITSGNTNDRTPVRDMVKGLKAKLIGDKGYLSKKLFADLFQNGVQLITKIKKGMKNHLMETADKLMLMKRSFIETISSSLKSVNTLIHTRHRNPLNAFTHLLAGLINYQLRANKPSLNPFINS